MNEDKFKKSLEDIDLTNVDDITDNEQLKNLVGNRIRSIERSHAIKLLLLGMFGILLVVFLYYLLFEVFSTKTNLIAIPIGLIFICVTLICSSLLKIFNTLELLLIGIFGILLVAFLYYLLFEVFSVKTEVIIVLFVLLFIFIAFVCHSILTMFNTFKNNKA